MGDNVDAGRASIDSLIEWLRERRVGAPDARLKDLLSSHPFQSDRLVDLVCIDLMQRRRMGHAVTVESYLAEFPSLLDVSTRLDLIDAEWCVATELGCRDSVENYIRRFPDLADPIRELARLDGVAPSMLTMTFGDSHRCSQDSTAGSADYSLGPLEQISADHADMTSHGVTVPDWFVGEKCIARSPGRWLIRGRDADRGLPMAMKVIELPTHVAPADHDGILAACELAAKVRNSVWIAPTVAVIQNRRLAVIRRWVFAHPWQRSSISPRRESELRRLASLAFAIQSAHDVGATHGGIHLDNLMVNHQGNVQLVDAMCSRDGFVRWFVPPNINTAAASFSTPQYRAAMDVQDLIKLIVSIIVDWTEVWVNDAVGNFRDIAEHHPDEACAKIGALLIRLADNDNDDSPGANLAPQKQASSSTVTPRRWRVPRMRWRLPE